MTTGLLWMCNAMGESTYLSQGWLDFTGFKQDAALGWGWLAAVHPEDQPGVAAHMREAASAGASFVGRYRLRRADGSWADMVTGAMPSLSPITGEFLGFIGLSVSASEAAIESFRIPDSGHFTMPLPGRAETRASLHRALDLVLEAKQAAGTEAHEAATSAFHILISLLSLQAGSNPMRKH